MIAVNKLVLLIIFLVILFLILILLFGIGGPIGERINLENELRQCCIAYRAGGCERKDILCNSHFLWELVDKLKINSDDNQLRCFCNCDNCIR